MSEKQNSAVAEAPAAPTMPGKPVKKKHGKKQIKKLIAIVVTIAILAAAAFSIWYFVFRKKTTQGSILPSTATIDTIRSTVQGNGNAKPKDTAAITLTAGGTVQEVFVSEGEKVTAGQPLYKINSSVAQEAVTAAQESLNRLSKDMKDLQKALDSLTVTAPFSGKLIEVGKFQVGENAPSGTAVATLVNDLTLKLPLYYSYAYENDIYIGQSVEVSIPSTMSTYTGTVEKINKVSRVVPEGATLFEVVVTLQNPGTLTADMEATASMIAANGSSISPYENGKLEYYETREITTKTAGPVLSVNLLKYSNVIAGQTLLALGAEDQESLIRAKQKEIDDAQKKLSEAQKALENFNAVAPIDGVVVSCSLSPGQTVKANDTVITISNTTSMIVEITVDDRNISFVKPGMTIDLTDHNNKTYSGSVTNINMTASGSGGSGASGMTNYPVTLTVDNQDGTLLQGMWLNYSFVSSESENCVTVPIQCVKSISDKDGNPVSVVFLQADSRPENTVDADLPEPSSGDTTIQYPSENDGYYPVPVKTGLSDRYNVEITSGLSEGDVVFNSYVMTTAY